jgi:hypothetical protein
VALYNVHLANAMNQITPTSALETPSLSGLRAASSMETAKVLTKLLETMNSRFNFAEHKKLNEVQIGFLVGSILTNYWRWKIDEVVYVLREGIAGKLKTFDHIDEAVVLGWFREYEPIRDGLVVAAAHNERAAYLRDPIQLAEMGPMYVRAHCTSIEPEHLPAYEEQLRRSYPDRPELYQAVGAYQQELDIKLKRETIRLEELRAKARALIGEYDTENLPAPDLEAEAVKHFAAQRGIPKLADVVPAPMTIIRDDNAA